MNTYYYAIYSHDTDGISESEWAQLVANDPELSFSTTDSLDCIDANDVEFTVFAVKWTGDRDASFILAFGSIQAEGEKPTLLEKVKSIASRLNAQVR